MMRRRSSSRGPRPSGGDSGLLYPSAMQAAFGEVVAYDVGEPAWGLIEDERLNQPVSGGAPVSPTQPFRCDPSPVQRRPPRGRSHSARRLGPYSSVWDADPRDGPGPDPEGGPEGDHRRARALSWLNSGATGRGGAVPQDGYEAHEDAGAEMLGMGPDNEADVGPTQRELEGDSELGSVSASSQSRRRRPETEAGHHSGDTGVGALAAQMAMMQASILGTLRGSLKAEGSSSSARTSGTTPRLLAPEN